MVASVPELTIRTISTEGTASMTRRITSYNVCYTKLLRAIDHNANGPIPGVFTQTDDGLVEIRVQQVHQRRLQRAPPSVQSRRRIQRVVDADEHQRNNFV